MNQSSCWRLQIAERIAPHYAAYSHVDTVIVGGSTARGHADQYSDIEIGVFWNQPPQDAERMRVIEESQGDLVYLYAYDAAEEVWCDDFMMGRNTQNEPRSGVLIEVVHYRSEFMQRTLNDVLVSFDPGELKQNLIAGMMSSTIISGTALVETWRAQAGNYPRELAAAVINRYGVIDHFWRWEMFLHRGENLMLLYRAYADIEQRLLHMLLGLNHVYYFGFKWLDVIIDRMAIKPPDLASRMRMVYRVSPDQGAQELTRLVHETFDLIEQHMPEIEVMRLRNIFNYRRPVWTQQPPVANGFPGF